jgi:hypothetical protein
MLRTWMENGHGQNIPTIANANNTIDDVEIIVDCVGQIHSFHRTKLHSFPEPN